MLRQLGFYLDMLQALDRAGCGKPMWCPPLLHARAIATERPGAADSVRRITGTFYAARYGRERLTRERVKAVTRDLEELRAVLRTRR